MQDKIAVVDLETTGFSATKNNIVEIGIALLDVKTGEVSKLFDKIVVEDSFGDHCKKAWVFKNTSLKFEDVKKAEHIETYRSELQKIFNKYPITAYNTKFDFAFLEARGFIIKEKFPCLMNTSKEILKIPSARYGLKMPKFQETYTFFNKESDYIESHRAYDDAYHEAKIAYQIYKD